VLFFKSYFDDEFDTEEKKKSEGYLPGRILILFLKHAKKTKCTPFLYKLQAAQETMTTKKMIH
jgi:hypothetical protein